MEEELEYKVIKTKKLHRIVCPKCKEIVEAKSFIAHVLLCIDK